MPGLLSDALIVARSGLTEKPGEAANEIVAKAAADALETGAGEALTVGPEVVGVEVLAFLANTRLRRLRWQRGQEQRGWRDGATATVRTPLPTGPNLYAVQSFYIPGSPEASEAFAAAAPGPRRGTRLSADSLWWRLPI